MNIAGIIPARYGSTRLPGKPLALIQGKPMIVHVWERARQCASLSEVIVATDDERIAQAVDQAGAKWVMTSTDHPSGTDRCAEVLKTLHPAPDAVINIQGDEPFVDPAQISAIALLLQRPEVQIATLAKAIHDSQTLFDANKVKVVFAEMSKRALYFSRQAIPFVRSTQQSEWASSGKFFKHIGLYGYKTETLRQIVQLPVSQLETIESLEQLRWLEHGFPVHVALTDIETPAVDTPEDLRRIALG
jgi:3-deoxy-manno-octulosonate cytidylyltransferase (CMP-KDO synthetase)